MGQLALNYGEIAGAAQAARKTADYCEDYMQAIERKVTRKLGSLEGGMTGYAAQADMYARKKMDQLSQKKSRYQSYAQSLDTFADHAKSVDKSVSNAISRSYNLYVKEHDIHVNPVVEALEALKVWAGNAIGFGKMLKEAFEFGGKIFKHIGESLEYWYRCEGGKNVLKIAGAVVGLTAAVVAVVLAFPVIAPAIAAFGAAVSAIGTAGAIGAVFGAGWKVAVAIAAFVGGVITVVNFMTDLVHEVKAYNSARKGNAVESKMQSDVDSVSDWLRTSVYDSKEMNSSSMSAADWLNFIETVCAVVNFADLAKNGISHLRRNDTVQYLRNNSLSTIKTDLAAKVRDGFTALRTAGRTKWANLKTAIQERDVGNIIRDAKSAGRRFIMKWNDTTKAFNDAVTNNKLKNYANNYAGHHEWYKKLGYIAGKEGSNFSGNGGVEKLKKVYEYTENTSDYADKFMDEGWKGIAKKGAEDIINKKAERSTRENNHPSGNQNESTFKINLDWKLDSIDLYKSRENIMKKLEKGKLIRKRWTGSFTEE